MKTIILVLALCAVGVFADGIHSHGGGHRQSRRRGRNGGRGVGRRQSRNRNFRGRGGRQDDLSSAAPAAAYGAADAPPPPPPITTDYEEAAYDTYDTYDDSLDTGAQSSYGVNDVGGGGGAVPEYGVNGDGGANDAGGLGGSDDPNIAMLEKAVPGIPGEDYPIYGEVPDTAFACDGQVDGGYYADPEAECQVFHICTADGFGGLSKYSFLCPNGTIFNQNYFICDWWFNFDCAEAESLYGKNEEIRAEGEAATGGGGGFGDDQPIYASDVGATAPAGDYGAAAAPVDDYATDYSYEDDIPVYEEEVAATDVPSLSEYGVDATEAPLGSYGAASEDAAREARRNQFRGGRAGRTSSRRGRSRGRGGRTSSSSRTGRARTSFGRRGSSNGRNQRRGGRSQQRGRQARRFQG